MTAVLPLAQTTGETLNAKQVKPDGYSPTKWEPAVRWLVSGIAADAIATCIAHQIDHTLFAAAALVLLGLGIALALTLSADANAAPKEEGWVVTTDGEETR